MKLLFPICMILSLLAGGTAIFFAVTLIQNL